MPNQRHNGPEKPTKVYRPLCTSFISARGVNPTKYYNKIVDNDAHECVLWMCSYEMDL
jgi:hypothetical protein